MIADNIYDAVSKCFVLPFEEKNNARTGYNIEGFKRNIVENCIGHLKNFIPI